MDYIFQSCAEAIANACENKSFGVYYSEAQNPNPDIHIHDCCEIFYCLSGGKTFLIGDRLYDVHDQDLFLINQYEAHKITYDPDSDFHRYVFQISPEFLQTVSSKQTDLSLCFYPHKPGFDHRVHLSKETVKWMQDHLEVLSKPVSFGEDIIKNGTMTSILVGINRLLLEREGEDSSISGNNAVKIAIDYINENFADPLTLDMVAKATYLSVNQISRLFSEKCGTTIAKYITSKRITEAKKMLASGVGVTETAMRCGFGDYSGFIRTFKKSVGMTPGKYKGSAE